MSNGWIGVDLDGTLAFYDRWRGAEHIGDPIPAMVERVKRWRREGWEVRIFTARVDGGQASGVEEMREVDKVVRVITEWCQKHLGEVLPVTNIKDYGMVELWDDRAVQVEQNTGRRLGKSTRDLDPDP